MKKRSILKTIVTFATVSVLVATVCGCNKKNTTTENSEPVIVIEPAESDEPAGTITSEPVSKSGREDGERFEETIILEGMEEKVQYEHIVNTILGFEMDYDYESFIRESKADSECFISVYDDAGNPENYLEMTKSADDADTTAAAIIEKLSKTYETDQFSFTLDNAGECIKIDASVEKGTNQTADNMQAVYIIPASDGCIVATSHYFFEASEGFGRRFIYMLNTLIVLD